MVDTSMVVAPRRLTPEKENKSIKNGLNHFGDQNQIEIDVKHTHRDEVRPGSVHDRHIWPELGANSVDGAASKRDPLKEDGCRGHIQPTGSRDKQLTQPQIEANHQPWKTHR